MLHTRLQAVKATAVQPECGNGAGAVALPLICSSRPHSMMAHPTLPWRLVTGVLLLQC